MKLWIDEVRAAPEGYFPIKTYRAAERIIKNNSDRIELINIDADFSNHRTDGRNFLKLLEWLEENDYDFPIIVHTSSNNNIVRKIMIERNGWEDVLDMSKEELQDECE